MTLLLICGTRIFGRPRFMLLFAERWRPSFEFLPASLSLSDCPVAKRHPHYRPRSLLPIAVPTTTTTTTVAPTTTEINTTPLDTSPAGKTTGNYVLSGLLLTHTRTAAVKHTMIARTAQISTF